MNDSTKSKSFVISDEQGLAKTLAQRLDERTVEVQPTADPYEQLGTIVDGEQEVKPLDPKLDLESIPQSLTVWLLLNKVKEKIDGGLATDLVDATSLAVHDLYNDPTITGQGTTIANSVFNMRILVRYSLTVGYTVYQSYDEWILRVHPQLLERTESIGARWLKRKQGLVNWMTDLQSGLEIDWHSKTAQDFMTYINKRKDNG